MAKTARKLVTVDMFSSRTFTLMDESLKPFIFSHRINTLSYRFKLESHLRSDVRSALSDERNPDRAKKSVKTALRNSVMALRAAESDGRFVRVEFTDEERVKFFRELRDFQKHVDSSRGERAPLWNEVRSLREKASKDFGTIDSLKNNHYYSKLEKDLEFIDEKIFQRFFDAAMRISG